ncbi:MAG: PspA/IM30 family protein [Phycisphaerae bacterium]
MALIRRLQRITLGRIEAFLESLKAPHAVLPGLLAELDRAVDSAAQAEAKALSAFKSAQRRIDEANGKLLRLEQGAQLALSRDDEPLARRALAEQIRVQQEGESLAQRFEQARQAHASARQVRKQLQHSRRQIRRQAGDLPAVARAGQAAAKAEDVLSGLKDQADWALLDLVARMDSPDVPADPHEDEQADPDGPGPAAGVLAPLGAATDAPPEIRVRIEQIRNELQDS